MWNGEFFQRMNVYVDLVPAIKTHFNPETLKPLGVKPCMRFGIPKTSRHKQANHETLFQLSHSSTEQAVIAALPLKVKYMYGLILAKAARIASIARPKENLTSHYGLQEDIHVDDFITSYMLKTCLMKLLECKWTILERGSVCGWAIRIYQKLKADLEAKKIETCYGYNTLMDCTDCKVERGCCKKMKVTLAMTSQILDWLRQHEEQLNSEDMKQM